MITILKLYGGKIGGTEKACSTLVSLLSKLHSKSINIVYALKYNECPIQDNEFHLGITPSSKVIFYIKYFFSIIRLIKTTDLLICTDLASTSIASIAKIATNSKIKIVAWEHFPYEKNGKIITFLFKKFKLHHQLTKMIFNSESELHKFNFIGDKSKLLVIPNCIELPNLDIQHADSDDKNLKLLYIGRVSQEKGVDRLINAVVKFSQATTVTKVTLTIVGGGENLTYLQDKYRDNQDIVFAGFQSDVRKFYIENDLFVSGSMFECFPISVLEALSYSLPVLSMDNSGGTASILDKGACGFVVNSELEFLSKLVQLQNSTLRTNLGSKGREFVKENFTPCIIFNMWRDVIE